MERKKGTLFLYNGLYAISSYYEDLKHLESPVFEVFDEIDSCITVGFSDQSILYYLKNKIVDKALADELRKFKEHVEKIDAEYWNDYDFNKIEDWEIARKWAHSLLEKLGMERQGWDDSSTTNIYINDE
ncbi:hypothetical protein [Ekhidna sp. To15]|uniref:hypothetical protein n=1 Tax=Ekhidna sp. To15 TaxID=3395267 RepID=UPI003F51C64F